MLLLTEEVVKKQIKQESGGKEALGLFDAILRCRWLGFLYLRRF